jgi:hypothetical protein
MSRGTPVAGLIVLGPGVEVNAVERNALRTYGNSGDPGAHFAVEAVFVHAQIARRVAQPQEARL